MSAASGRRAALLGTTVDILTLEQFVEAVAGGVAAAAARGGPWLVLNHNLNSLALLRHDDGLRRFYERADLTFIDGMSVVGLLRLLGRPGVGRAHRLAVLEWLVPVLERAAAEGWPVVHIGSSEPVISEATRRLRATVPGVQLHTIAGFFDQRPGSADNEAVLAAVAEARPALVLVGMGMPRQEVWVEHHLDRLPPCVVVTVGGILGYWGGDRPTCPRWLGRLGLEWVFRLATEWSRLWRRYLVEPWVLVRPVAAEVWRRRVRRRA